jgi:ABC-type lipoprotein release transport system permease subunit
VVVLTIVLSVMTGFEQDLRSRILGLNPHIRVGDKLQRRRDQRPRGTGQAVSEEPRGRRSATISAQMPVSAQRPYRNCSRRRSRCLTSTA